MRCLLTLFVLLFGGLIRATDLAGTQEGVDMVRRLEGGTEVRRHRAVMEVRLPLADLARVL